MSEASQPSLEESAQHSQQAGDSEIQVPRGPGRDWLLGLLLFGLALSLLAAVGVAVLILLALFMPSLNLQSLVLSFPPTAPPLLRDLSGALTLLQLAAGLLLVLLFIAFCFYLTARWRVVRKRHLWPEAGCPACGHETLGRVHRLRKERLYAWVGIPVRRYHCRECRWQGVRIHRGPEIFSVPNNWAESLADNDHDSARAALPQPESGEDRAAILGTALYNGSNEKWQARLNDLGRYDTFPPLHAEAESGAAAQPGDNSETPSIREDRPSHRAGAAAQEDGAQPAGEHAPSTPQPFPPLVPGEGLDNGGSLSDLQERHAAANRGKIAAPFGLNFRAGPRRDAALLGLLAPGTDVLLLDQVTASDGTTWHRVEINKRHGWVLSAFVEGVP